MLAAAFFAAALAPGFSIDRFSVQLVGIPRNVDGSAHDVQVSRTVAVFNARVVYGETLRWKQADFVLAAESLGVAPLRILARHILPQAAPSLVVSATLGVAYAILTESAVSYLGLGVQPPMPSWGNMLQRAQQYVFTAPVLAIYPGFAITVLVLAFNFLGDGLRDRFDPRARTGR